MSSVAGVAALCAVALRGKGAALLPKAVKYGVYAVAGVTVCQFTLGVTTLWFVVPPSLGAAHQAGALTLFSVFLFLMHSLG
jgi:cytochrome c oxidase assembly protein subunit 15